MIQETLRYQLLERRSTHPHIDCPTCGSKAPLVGGLMETHLPETSNGGWSCHFVYRCQENAPANNGGASCGKGWITSDLGKIHGFQALTMHEL